MRVVREGSAHLFTPGLYGSLSLAALGLGAHVWSRHTEWAAGVLCWPLPLGRGITRLDMTDSSRISSLGYAEALALECDHRGGSEFL